MQVFTIVYGFLHSDPDPEPDTYAYWERFVGGPRGSGHWCRVWRRRQHCGGHAAASSHRRQVLHCAVTLLYCTVLYWAGNRHRSALELKSVLTRNFKKNQPTYALCQNSSTSTVFLSLLSSGVSLV